MKRKPQRTCIGCRKTTNKADLIRIVKTPYQTIEIDLNKKSKGRGAYICSNRECIKRALKKKVLNHAFKQVGEVPDVDNFIKDIKNRIKVEIE